MCGAFCAVLADGSAVTWGYPERGGDSSKVQEQLCELQSVAGSDGAFAALRSDGTVVCWGDAMTGGDSSAVQDQLKNVREVCANGAWASLSEMLLDIWLPKSGLKQVCQHARWIGYWVEACKICKALQSLFGVSWVSLAVTDLTVKDESSEW